MSPQTNCPKCQSENIYEDGTLWVCPECTHEWNANDLAHASSLSDSNVEDSAGSVGTKDAFGTLLQDGDSVTVIKELRIKGSSSVVKVGTKVKNIRLGDAGDGHDIMCKIDGLGSINLKSEYVRKA